MVMEVTIMVMDILMNMITEAVQKMVRIVIMVNTMGMGGAMKIYMTTISVKVTVQMKEVMDRIIVKGMDIIMTMEKIMDMGMGMMVTTVERTEVAMVMIICTGMVMGITTAMRGVKTVKEICSGVVLVRQSLTTLWMS